MPSSGICQQCRRSGFNPWVGKIPWRRKWQPTPVSLPGKFHGRRSLAGYSPWGHKESDMTEQFHFHRILVPQPGTEPRPMAVKAWSPNHWTEPHTGHTLLSGRSSFNKNMCFYNNLDIDFLFVHAFIYLGCASFIAVYGLSLVAASRSYSAVAVHGFLIAVASLVAENGL